MNESADNSKTAILVVDDNEEILDFLVDDLGEKYEVYAAESVKRALEILDKHIIHLIISDIIMPATNGYDFCSMVKSDIEYSHIPFIMLTAKNTLHSKIEGLEKGADAYLEKPFSPEHLQVQIANLLANRNRMKEFFSAYPQANIKNMAHSSADEKFLAKLNAYILQNIDDPALDVDKLSETLYISRPTLYRKIKVILDLTPNELINITRLKKAAELLAQGDHSINEISVMVGFNSATHFGRNFLKQFSMTPSSYALSAKNQIRQNT